MGICEQTSHGVSIIKMYGKLPFVLSIAEESILKIYILQSRDCFSKWNDFCS